MIMVHGDLKNKIWKGVIKQQQKKNVRGVAYEWKRGEQVHKSHGKKYFDIDFLTVAGL